MRLFDIFSLFKKENEHLEEKLGLYINNVTLPIKKEERNENQNDIDKKKESLIIERRISLTDEGTHMRKYLVVLDTTNRPEVVDRGLMGGLKNFYFVYASDVNQAKVMVLSTFAHAPHIVEQIQYSLTVTPLDEIINILSSKMPLWSYIPFRREHRFPGQKSVPPEQKVDPYNKDMIIPMKPEEVPHPVTPPQKNDVDMSLLQDTPNVKPIYRNENSSSDNNKAVELLQQLVSLLKVDNSNVQTLLQALQNSQNSQTPEDKVPFYRVNNVNNDVELQKRMNDVLESAKPRHIHADPDASIFNEEEQKAKMEVEQFKNLSPQEIEKIHENIRKEILTK